MKKIIILSLLLCLLSSFWANAEELSATKTGETQFSFVSLFEQSNRQVIAKTIAAKKNSDKFEKVIQDRKIVFMGLGLLFTMLAGNFMIMGVIGGAFFGISKRLQDRGETFWNVFWAPGVAMLAVGWTFFGVFLVAGIIFWTFLGIAFRDGKKKIISMTPVANGIGFSVKL